MDSNCDHATLLSLSPAGKVSPSLINMVNLYKRSSCFALWVAITSWWSVGWQEKLPREIPETLMASATDGRFRHSSYKGAFMYEEGQRGGRRCPCVATCRREGPHLFMAVVVMVEELCTFVIIGPGPISWGLLPRSVEVTATVCKSCAPQKGTFLITSWQSFPLITQPEPVLLLYV